jgi:hypothetical protein
MLKPNTANLLFLLAFSPPAFGQSPASVHPPAIAQQDLAGKVIKRGGTEIIPNVSIININLKKSNMSDMGGNYKIPARPGDTILFSSASYQPDTVVVSTYMFTESWLVDLKPRVTVLPTANVEEVSNYQIDSLKRRDDYRSLLDKKHPIRLFDEKTQTDAPGLFISPVDYYSKTERDKRRLKRRLKQQEEDHYIDYNFPPARVALLTRLSGDSLQLFLHLYRPSYAFCRKSNSEDILLYINDKLVLFRKKPTLR